MLNSGWDTQIRSGILGLTESDIKDSQDWTPRFSRPDSESCTWTPRIKHPDSDSQRYHLQLLVAPLGPLWLPWGCLEVPWGTPVAPLELRGGPMGHLCGSLGAAWRCHRAPLWLPWGCLEVPWSTSVAPLGLPGGPMGHLCGSLGASWEPAWPQRILKAKQAN